MNTKTKATTVTPPPTPEELRLNDVTARIGEEQIKAIQRQAFVQDILKEFAPGLAEQVGGDLGLQEQDTEGLGISAAEERQVRQFGDEQLAMGSSDLDAQFTEGLGILRDELAPSRGLRPSDSPIMDRGGLLLKENLRQKAQLGRSVRADTSSRLLDLSGRAQANRLQLLSGLSGLGIAPQGNTAQAAASMAQTRAGQASTSSSGLNTQAVGTGISTLAYLALA